MPKYTLNQVKFQLLVVEWLMSNIYNDQLDWYHLRWKRHYLLKRLLTLQLKEFNRV